MLEVAGILLPSSMLLPALLLQSFWCLGGGRVTSYLVKAIPSITRTIFMRGKDFAEVVRLRNFCPAQIRSSQ